MKTILTIVLVLFSVLGFSQNLKYDSLMDVSREEILDITKKISDLKRKLQRKNLNRQ